jgi:hypothetical protein
MHHITIEILIALHTPIYIQFFLSLSFLIYYSFGGEIAYINKEAVHIYTCIEKQCVDPFFLSIHGVDFDI